MMDLNRYGRDNSFSSGLVQSFCSVSYITYSSWGGPCYDVWIFRRLHITSKNLLMHFLVIQLDTGKFYSSDYTHVNGFKLTLESLVKCMESEASVF